MASMELTQSRALFQNRWWIVFCIADRQHRRPGPAVIFTVNVFMVPVTTELGWTRGMFSSGLLASAVVSPIMTPLFGTSAWISYGIQTRRPAGGFLYALALCSFALLSPDAYWVIF